MHLRSQRPFGLRNALTPPTPPSVVPQAALTNTAVLAMSYSGHLPDPPWLACRFILIARLLPTSALIPSICTWCRSDNTPRALFCLQSGCTLCIVCSSAVPASHTTFLFSKSVLTSCCCPLNGFALSAALMSLQPILGSTPQLWHPPGASTHLYTDFLCLLTDPL
jgi:hypothetical protein